MVLNPVFELLKLKLSTSYSYKSSCSFYSMGSLYFNSLSFNILLSMLKIALIYAIPEIISLISSVILGKKD